ncbi:MAG: N-acetyltransferase [Pseudomonadota bacterium]
MKLLSFEYSMKAEVVRLFAEVFSASENEDEGRLIGDLVANLIETPEEGDVLGFVAVADGILTGSIFFSRFSVPGSDVAFILSPVAVATDAQRTGVGQQLIRHGLERLKSQGVDLAITYGDPGYYVKVGFRQITEDIVSAPFVLSQPEGWLAQPLSSNRVKANPGPTRCVQALSDQRYW